MQDVQQTIIGQYATSPILTALINSMNAAIDPSSNIDNFYNLMFNPDTAVGYGLDCIGRIVGVNRVLTVATGQFFGYSGPGTRQASGTPYNTNVYNTGTSGTENVSLSDAAFRTLVFAKMAANLSGNSVADINFILIILFGQGNGSGPPPQPAAYCTDGQNMTMTYTLSFTPTNIQVAIIENSGVLPRPSGVSVTLVHP
jgi:hypothetical protein